MIIEKFAIAVGVIVVHFLNGSNLFDIGNDIKPDFMFLLVMFFALKRGGLTGLWIGFFGGLLTDSSLGAEIGIAGKYYYKIGIHALAYSIIGYLVGKFGRNLYNENFLSVSVSIFVLTLIVRVFSYLVFLFFFHPNKSYSFISTSLYNAIIAPMIFFALSWAYRLESQEAVE